MKLKLFRKKFGSIFGLGQREVTEAEKASMRRAWLATAIAAALSFGGTTVARAEENNASFDGENPEMTQVLTDDELNEFAGDSYVDVETPEIFVDSSDDYVEESASYEEPVASEENSAEVEEPVVNEENSAETEETVVSEEGSYTDVETPEIFVSGEDTPATETSSTVSNESSSAEASSTVSVDASGNQTSTTVSTEVTEEGDYIVETETEETTTSRETSWSFYVFEKDGRRFVFTDVADDPEAQQEVTKILNERYGNSPIPTDIYGINQLMPGYNKLTYGGVDLTVYLDENKNITVISTEVTDVEKFDETVETPTTDETEQKTDSTSHTSETTTEETKQTVEEQKTGSKSESTSTDKNVYEVARDSYVVAVDEQGQYYIYIGGTGLDHNQREALLHDLYRDHPELVAKGNPIIENGVTNFDLNGKKVVFGAKSDDLSKNDEASHDPNAKPGDKPHEEPPTPTPPTPTPPTPTPPTPTPPTPTPPTPTPPTPTPPTPTPPTPTTPTPTPPTPTTPTPKTSGNNIPKTGDTSSLIGAASGLLGGLTMFGAGLASSRKKYALSRESVASFGYMEAGSAYEKAMVKKYGRIV